MYSKIKIVQEWLKKHHIEGWLLYDFRKSNPLACRFLDISPTQLLTRRFFYWIPQVGEPVKLISAVENPLMHLPGKELRFRSWQEMHVHLKQCLHGAKTILMEYSSLGATPEISRVDAGTIDLVRSMGVEVASSGNLLQAFTCVWDEQKWKSHQFAAHLLDRIAEKTWGWIAERLNHGVSEYEVQQFMLNEMMVNGCVTDHPPICAVNAHSADPHYEPKQKGSASIKQGDWVLIDLWCKQKQTGAVYGDITRVGVVANSPTMRQQEIFALVQKAQATALQFVEERYSKKQPLFGYEVDRVCRQVIEQAGYGAYFVHRTGHNIDESDHGPGAHLDDLETHDERELLPSTCFSIEPGIYLPGEFGVRLEYDVFLHPDGHAIVSGGIQNSIHLIS